jgi:16S rRNA (cytidine1402-2'-O)-methyltransferase
LIDVRNVNVIAAEDTRHTAKLLAHFGILNKTVWSYYSHNSYEQTPKLVKLAKSGEIIALVSDAGKSYYKYETHMK